ncbi:hypothetical protein EDD22DRAFT_784267 [Suillus occidentalis]|nr:hypothetical protein EDD22DRAFT_784267 [Suillus occidentalis]
MAFLGLRKWPTPAFVSTVLRPFLAASVVTFYLVSKMQEMGVRTETYAKDPENPNGAQIAKEAHH